MRILVVDDEPLIGRGIQVALRPAGHEVHFLTDPLEVETAFDQGPWDVAIVDLVMPKRDGIEVMTWISTHHPETSIVFSSGLTQAQTAQRGLLAGALAFLPKPFAKDEILAILTRVKEARRTSGTPGERAEPTPPGEEP